MFERPHHQRIARVLSSLDGPLLQRHGALFGGGTSIALRYGEYRESVDIDFLVSDAAGYRELRQILTGPEGLNALVHPKTQPLVTPREVRADQYGIRTQVHIDGYAIKLEIVREARIALGAPSSKDVVCGIATLTPLDSAASKLLANSDRQADDGVFSRDVIDLGGCAAEGIEAKRSKIEDRVVRPTSPGWAPGRGRWYRRRPIFRALQPILLLPRSLLAMMSLRQPLLREALNKAEEAYGASVIRDLGKAIDRLQNRQGWLERCMPVMAIDTVPKALLWQKIRRLRQIRPPSANPEKIGV